MVAVEMPPVGESPIAPPRRWPCTPFNRARPYHPTVVAQSEMEDAHLQSAKDDDNLTLKRQQSINLTAAAGVLASASMFAQHDAQHDAQQHDTKHDHNQPDTSDNSQQLMSTTIDGVLGLGAVPRRRRGSVIDVGTMEDFQQPKRYDGLQWTPVYMHE